MMKSAILIVALVSVVVAQRPFYAQRPVGVPDMLDQFQPAAPAAPAAAGGVPNRIGEEAAAAAAQDRTPLRLGDGEIGDPYLTPRLGDWPREHMPFWYLNQKHIMEHRGQKVPARTPAAPAVEADPTERRLTAPPRRRPAKQPARPAPVDDEEDDVGARLLTGGNRRYPARPPQGNWQF